METKKVLLYTGGALLLGAVGFFVWSFFQKIEIPIGSTTITLGSDSNPNQDPNGSNANNDSDNSTPPLVAENSSSSSNPRFDPNVNNPFQIIEDDSDYSQLDAFIHRGV
jgi:hypothetical protein